MEKTNYTALYKDSADASFQLQHEKDRRKKAKNFIWTLILRTNQAVGCILSHGNNFWDLLGGIKKRLLRGQGVIQYNDTNSKKSFYFSLILAYLVVTLALLVFDLAAHLNGWHDIHSQETFKTRKGFEAAYLAWLEFRAHHMAPQIQALSNICMVLFLIQSADRLLLCLGCLWIKLRKIKPRIEGNPFSSDKMEGLTNNFPRVLVQIPMCNEKEVYRQSISSVCQLDWPKERLLIQVLDDSDDESIQSLIKGEISKWNQKGINIIYRHRLVRRGYKAGNLKSAMNCDYVKSFEFVAIFDADFKPNPDFLKRTIPYFENDPELGLVQARWAFVNKNENLLTKFQNINMSFHFEVEQQVNGVFLNFFGFNGTAGVWRIKALEESGGWNERTTVEDMDLAVRAHINGWKFIFLNDVKVPCELPECYESYRKQQHRWHSGPVNLFRLCLPAILKSKIPSWKKANAILLFFLLRKLIVPFYSFAVLCILLPLTVFVPEAELPAWFIYYVPLVISFLSTLPAPRSIPFIIPNLLFENTMSVVKCHAMLSGLFQLGSSYEWVVTKKAGRSSEPGIITAKGKESDTTNICTQLRGGVPDSEVSGFDKLQEHQEAPQKPKQMKKMHKKELVLALLLFTASVRSLLSAKAVHFVFFLLQGVSFLLVGLNVIFE